MLKNFLDNINNNPVLLAGIAQVLVPVLVVFNLIHWTEAQTAVLYTAITAITGLFVRGNTVAAGRVEQKTQEMVAHREMAGTTGTGDGMTPAATPGPATRGMSLLLALALASSMACASAPPNLTPEANIAFKGTQAVKALDLLRDTAISANAQTPPLLDEATTRKVVMYHQSSVKIIQSSPSGWKPAVNQGLDEVVNNLKPGDQALLAPYVALIKTVIQEVTR